MSADLQNLMMSMDDLLESLYDYAENHPNAKDKLLDIGGEIDHVIELMKALEDPEELSQ